MSKHIHAHDLVVRAKASDDGAARRRKLFEISQQIAAVLMVENRCCDVFVTVLATETEATAPQVPA